MLTQEIVIANQTLDSLTLREFIQSQYNTEKGDKHEVLKQIGVKK